MYPKEYFWDTSGVSSQNNIALQLMKGTKAGQPVMSVDPATPAVNRIDGTSVYYDKDGSLFGAAGRLHLWYNATQTIANTDGSLTFVQNRCYTYSDGMGAAGSWVKPNLGLYEFPAGSGNKDNNIIHPTVGSTTINPNDKDYPIRHLVVDPVASPTKFYRAKGKNPADCILDATPVQVFGATVSGIDGGAIFEAQGKLWLFYQYFYNPTYRTTSFNADDPNAMRLFAVNQTDDLYPSTSWTYPMPSTMYQTTKSMPDNKTALDSSNVMPQGQTYVGSGLMGGEDFNGDFILLAPSMFTRTGGISDGYLTAGLGLMRSVTDGTFQRIRGDDDDTLIQLDHNTPTEWDYGMIFMGTGLVETDSELIGFYGGFNKWHNINITDPVQGVPYGQEKCNLGMVTWRKDGLTAIQNQNATVGDVMTVLRTKNVGDIIKINYNGNVKVELLDSNDQTIIGYSKIDCTLRIGDYIGQVVTWGSRNASELTQFKLKFYLEG